MQWSSGSSPVQWELYVWYFVYLISVLLGSLGLLRWRMELHRRHRQVGVKNYGGAGRQCRALVAFVACVAQIVHCS